MMTRLFAVVAILAGSFALASPAIAGEITGNGKQTPIKAQQSAEAPAGPAQSICAFSGLNDVPDGSDDPEDPFAPGRVQSFGDGVQQVVRTFPGNPSDWVGLLQENKPGIFCKGFPTGGGGE